MEENQLMQPVQKQPFVTVKNVLRILSGLLVLFVFCPSFLVSCAGEEIEVNVMTAVNGISYYGEKVVDPQPVMLLCLVFPAILLILLFKKGIFGLKGELIFLLSAVSDFVMWILFRAVVKQIAKENGCTVSNTTTYVFNNICLLAIIVLTALIMMKKITWDTVLIQNSSQGTAKTKVMPTAEVKKPVSFCSNCGKGIVAGSKFCDACGNPVVVEPQPSVEDKEEGNDL